MTNEELILKIKAEIERRITDNTFGAKLELIDILAWLDTLESEKPINPDDAMKELNEKIALVKERGTWDGVDVDKYMDEVRGREPEKPMNLEGLEEELDRFIASGKSITVEDCGTYKVSYHDFKKVARHFAKWGAEHLRDYTKMIDKSLEEAAEEYAIEYAEREKPKDADGEIWKVGDVMIENRMSFEDGFKAGAKWALNQGVKATGTISPRGIIYDNNVGYHLFLKRYHYGDKVEVQIRKIE